jgi:hypothetical protein
MYFYLISNYKDSNNGSGKEYNRNMKTGDEHIMKYVTKRAVCKKMMLLLYFTSIYFIFYHNSSIMYGIQMGITNCIFHFQTRKPLFHENLPINVLGLNVKFESYLLLQQHTHSNATSALLL